MSARDDLVAAMEAWEKYQEYLRNTNPAMPRSKDLLLKAEHAALQVFRNGGGPALLALLDAEPVAWRVDGFAPDYAIFTTKVDRANLPRQRGVTVTALYARPEASDE